MQTFNRKNRRLFFDIIHQAHYRRCVFVYWIGIFCSKQSSLLSQTRTRTHLDTHKENVGKRNREIEIEREGAQSLPKMSAVLLSFVYSRHFWHTRTQHARTQSKWCLCETRNALLTAAHYTRFAYRMLFDTRWVTGVYNVHFLLWSQAFGPLTLFLSNRLSGLTCARVYVSTMYVRTYLFSFVLVLSHLFWSWKQVFYKAYYIRFGSYLPHVTVLVNGFQFILAKYTKIPSTPEQKCSWNWDDNIQMKSTRFVWTANQPGTWIACDSALIIYCFFFVFFSVQHSIYEFLITYKYVVTVKLYAHFVFGRAESWVFCNRSCYRLQVCALRDSKGKPIPHFYR